MLDQGWGCAGRKICLCIDDSWCVMIYCSFLHVHHNFPPKMPLYNRLIEVFHTASANTEVILIFNRDDTSKSVQFIVLRDI